MMSRTGNESAVRFDFTLVEVLLAVMVLAIGLGGVLTAYAKAAGTIRVAQDNVEAFLLLKEKMTEIELQQKQNGALPAGRREGIFAEPFHNYAWETEVRAGPEAALVEVVTTVRQIHSGRHFSLATYLPRDRGLGRPGHGEP